MNRAHRQTLPVRLVIAASILMLAACSHAPEQADIAPATDIAKIGPRPHVFGRHAWDRKQACAAAQARASAPVAAVVTPQPVEPMPVEPVKAAAPVPPPPVVQPQVLAPAPAPPAAPAPVVAAVQASQPVAAPANLAAASLAPTSPAPTKPPAVQKARAAKPEKKSGSLFFWPHPAEAAPPPIVGGYQPATDKTAVAAAAAFAVHQSPRYLLKGIYSAKVQVVAGTNYSLCLWVRTPGHEANPFHRRMVAATVFQGLDQHFELTSWQEVNTCQAGS